MDNTINDTFGATVIAYTRAMAIEDGVLVDVSEYARYAGFRLPVAVSDRLLAEVTGDTAITDTTDLSKLARLLRTANAAVIRMPDQNTDRVFFGVPGADGGRVAAWMRYHGGDNGEPVMTLMRVGDD